MKGQPLFAEPRHYPHDPPNRWLRYSLLTLFLGLCSGPMIPLLWSLFGRLHLGGGSFVGYAGLFGPAGLTIAVGFVAFRHLRTADHAVLGTFITVVGILAALVWPLLLFLLFAAYAQA